MRTKTKIVLCCDEGHTGGSSHGGVVSVLDCDFELQSRYYVLFRINSHGKGIKYPMKVDMSLNKETKPF